eukprot:TRINITY_DN87409_c0_g1_i1.p1 TRINITY_DN87409_c0_g1~~TRINITY_DN87409_c0_g1_i1.p1  ORF type:complete len:120 (+),score=9.77 TRINITY_DN87409_c0_g1_i1:67-426(+)
MMYFTHVAASLALLVVSTSARSSEWPEIIYQTSKDRNLSQSRQVSHPDTQELHKKGIREQVKDWRVFYINLYESTTRRANMQKALETFPGRVERIPAISSETSRERDVYLERQESFRRS